MTTRSARRTHADTDELYPIRVVCSLTGVNPVTLRAWERRYGLIESIRTASGHRMYTQAASPRSIARRSHASARFALGVNIARGVQKLTAVLSDNPVQP